MIRLIGYHEIMFLDRKNRIIHKEVGKDPIILREGNKPAISRSTTKLEYDLQLQELDNKEA